MLIDLGGIAELRRIRDDGDRIAIGAMAPHHDVMRDDLVKQHVELLAQATATVADNQVRHRGTLGGALAHADPAGDLGGVALALEAEFVITGPGRHPDGVGGRVLRRLLHHRARPRTRSSPRCGSRSTPAGAATTRSSTAPRSRGRWCAIAAAVRVEGGTIAEARVGLTNMGTTPMRARGVEEALVGQPATADAVRAAAERVTEGTAAPSDADAAADYREHLARVLTGRAVLAAAG